MVGQQSYVGLNDFKIVYPIKIVKYLYFIPNNTNHINLDLKLFKSKTFKV